MRFILSDDFWVLDALSPAEWHLICELPLTAAGENFDESVKDRLFPSPLAADALADEKTESQIEDWNSFVRPDLAEGFREVRERVTKDIAKAETFPSTELLDEEEFDISEVEGSDFRRVSVPFAHTEAWYSTLNQARILMNEAYEIAESEERLSLGLDGSETIDDDRILILSQYEMYSVIQSILVENVMNL